MLPAEGEVEAGGTEGEGRTKSPTWKQHICPPQPLSQPSHSHVHINVRPETDGNGPSVSIADWFQEPLQILRAKERPRPYKLYTFPDTFLVTALLITLNTMNSVENIGYITLKAHTLCHRHHFFLVFLNHWWLNPWRRDASCTLQGEHVEDLLGAPSFCLAIPGCRYLGWASMNRHWPRRAVPSDGTGTSTRSSQKAF